MFLHRLLNGTPDIELAEWSGLAAPEGNPVIRRIPLSADHLTRLQPRAFERFCQLWLNRQGYITHLTPASGDGGVDVVGIRRHEGLLIQCKSSGRCGQALGWEAVRDVVGGAAAYRARYPEVGFKLVAATNQYFNAEAVRQAQLQKVVLLQQSDWITWLKDTPVYLDEVARDEW